MKYGVVDIGSNTVVLIIYNTDTPVPEVLFYESDPVRLVQYNTGGHISQEGIDRTCETLRRYREILSREQVESFGAFITEPARHIDNKEELLAAFQEAGFNVQALSGREEAEYDFEGSRLYVPDITTGNAFDIGGGSTELIAFRDGKIMEAVSLPWGCVRLLQSEINAADINDILMDAFDQYPLLQSVSSDTMVGIGGTCRAAGRVCDAVYGTGKVMYRRDLGTIYRKLNDYDQETTEIMHRKVDPGRWEVFMPGVRMLMGILWAYNADKVVISEGCVREGFLMRQIKNKG